MERGDLNTQGISNGGYFTTSSTSGTRTGSLSVGSSGTTINGGATINGGTTINNGATINGDLDVDTITGNTNIGAGSTTTLGFTNANNGLTVSSGQLTANGTVQFNGGYFHNNSDTTNNDQVRTKDTDYDYDTGVYESTETVTNHSCLLYTSPSPRDRQKSRMPSSA